MNVFCKTRLRQLGYGDLLDNFNLATHGVSTLYVSDFVMLPIVLSPESKDPKEPSARCYRLSPAQHREILSALFEEPEIAGVL